MKINQNKALSTSKVLLVPYHAHHVPAYHEWMTDPDLQALTASEPLTIEEEYDMQRSWRNDRDKLTFIVCLPLSDGPNNQPPNLTIPNGADSDEQMLGDINLFLSEDDIEKDVETNALESSHPIRNIIGEIELMIARKDMHHQGYGRAALLTMIWYILANWQSIAQEYDSTVPELAYLRVKINQTNERSVRLFQSVGFEQVGESPNYFGEVELRWRRDVESLKQLKWFEEPELLQYS